MRKISKNQKGFSVIESLLVLVIVVLIGVVGFVVYKNHHKTLGPITGKWIPYSSSKGNFSASFPTSPNFPKSPLAIGQTTKSRNGISYTINGVISNDIASGTTYTVFYETYPSNAKTPTLASFLDEILHNNQFQVAHLVSSKRLTVNGNQAETFDIHATTNGINYDITGEIATVGKIIYQAVAQIEGKAQTANTQYFVNSLKVGQ